MFRNPYFQDTHQRKNIFRLAGFLLGFVCVLALVLFFLLHPFFQIKKVQIHGIEQVSAEQVNHTIDSYLSERVLLIFTRRNEFLFRANALESLLKKNYAFSQLVIKKKGTELTISLTERTSHLIWQTAEKKYIVDLEGVIVREATQKDTLPLFVDRQNVPTQIGDAVLTPQEVKAVFLFQDRLTAQNISFTQTQFDRLAGKWTGVLTTDGYTILFDTTGDIDAQANRLELLRREKMKDPTKLQYIDLRFGDHVYVK